MYTITAKDINGICDSIIGELTAEAEFKGFEKIIGEYINDFRVSRSERLVSMMHGLYSFYIKKHFSEITVSGVEQLRDFMKKNPDTSIVFTPGHKSNLDYWMMGWVFYPLDFEYPFYSANHSLQFWPIGRLFSGLSTYFIRKKITEPLYQRLLALFLSGLIEKGAHQVLFLEGGLTRSGRCSRPREGLLGTMIDIFNRKNSRPGAVVPVSIVYDIVPEDHILTDRSVKSIDYYHRSGSLMMAGVFRGKFGSASIEFGKPLNFPSGDIHSPGISKGICENIIKPEKFAQDIMNRIKGMGRVTPVMQAACFFTENPSARICLSEPLKAMPGLCGNFDIESVKTALMLLRNRKVLIAEKNQLRVSGRGEEIIRYYYNQFLDIVSQPLC